MLFVEIEYDNLSFKKINHFDRIIKQPFNVMREFL